MGAVDFLTAGETGNARKIAEIKINIILPS